jgi:diguanylate cyclase (GGDEF)-like protein
MNKKSEAPRKDVGQEHPADAPPGWPAEQDRLANKSGLSLLLVDGHQPPAIVISNNNSICEALQSSPEHVKLCDPYCGDAHRQAMATGRIHYKCHAGLNCFAQPVKIGKAENLAVIGGRAFAKRVDYDLLVERFLNGDLKDLLRDEVFRNIIFTEVEQLDELADRVTKATEKLLEPQPRENGPKQTAPPSPARTSEQSIALEDEVERLRSELDYRVRFNESLQNFVRRISSNDPDKTYRSIVTNLKELLQSERASLFVFDATANELILKAADGLPVEVSDVGHLRPGEGVAGEVLMTGEALVVEELRAVGRSPAKRQKPYKSQSFISYPLRIGGRTVGVLNVTDKRSGGPYNQIDLSLLDLVCPQVSLALERAEWQERATEFQLMSITDPLTGLRNRRYLEERLSEELNRSKRYDYPMSFLMIDIDDFKNYNDLNGHPAGDQALQITAHCLRAGLRSADVASRYGGEEFSILLPQTSLSEAGMIAERIRERVAATDYPHGKSQPLGHVTISIGVSTFTGTINAVETVIAAADRALYNAKSQGKNRIEFYQENPVRKTKNDERR